MLLNNLYLRPKNKFVYIRITHLDGYRFLLLATDSKSVSNSLITKALSCFSIAYACQFRDIIALSGVSRIACIMLQYLVQLQTWIYLFETTVEVDIFISNNTFKQY